MAQDNEDDDTTSRGRSLPAIMTAREVQGIHISLAKIHAKFDLVFGLKKDVEALEVTTKDHEARLIRAEAFQGFAMWLINGGWMVVVAIIGTGAFWLGAH